MFNGVSTVVLGKYVHESRPLASPNAPEQGTFVFPPAPVPNARWLPEVSKPLIGFEAEVAGGLLPQRTVPTVLPASTTVPPIVE